MPVDELKERRAAEKGERAQMLLDSPLLNEVFDALEQEYIGFWRNSTPLGDTAGRERLWQAVHILGTVKSHLQTIVNDGKVSRAELNALRQGATTSATG